MSRAAAIKAWLSVPPERRAAMLAVHEEARAEVKRIAAWHRKAARLPGMKRDAIVKHVAQAQRADDVARDFEKLTKVLRAVEVEKP